MRTQCRERRPGRKEVTGERQAQVDIKAQCGRWQLARGDGRPHKFRSVADPTPPSTTARLFDKNQSVLFARPAK
jgi:hypothetical protein